MSKPFHLAWFLGQSFTSKTWRSTWPGSVSDVARWMMPDIFIDLAKGMERACMDYMIIEDSSNVPYTYKGSHDTYLQYAQGCPKLDPAVLVPWLAQATQNLGLVPTLSVSEYPPYLLARLINSLDHVTEGRIGWNCVTGSNDGTAQNYGHDKHRPHDERYEVADEFADVVTRLWEAWEPDAVVLDRDKPMFADGSKVRPIHHEGKYFKVRGPINAPRSPQGRVPIVQAGGSAAGKKFASKWADTIITEGSDIQKMKEYRQEVRRNAAAIGRNPDDIKLLFLCSPIVDTTMEAALERRRQQQEDSLKYVDMQLSGMSRLTDRHRLLQVRSRRAAAAHAHDQWPPVLAGPVARQAAARDRAHLRQQGQPRLYRHRRSCGGGDAGGHGGGGWRRLPDLQYRDRPPVCDGGLRRAGARIAAPWLDPQGLRAQAPRRQSEGVLRLGLVTPEPDVASL
jgi:long-chain alkane monooxygenase